MRGLGWSLELAPKCWYNVSDEEILALMKTVYNKAVEQEGLGTEYNSEDVTYASKSGALLIDMCFDFYESKVMNSYIPVSTVISAFEGRMRDSGVVDSVGVVNSRGHSTISVITAMKEGNILLSMIVHMMKDSSVYITDVTDENGSQFLIESLVRDRLLSMLNFGKKACPVDLIELFVLSEICQFDVNKVKELMRFNNACSVFDYTRLFLHEKNLLQLYNSYIDLDSSIEFSTVFNRFMELLSKCIESTERLLWNDLESCLNVDEDYTLKHTGLLNPNYIKFVNSMLTAKTVAYGDYAVSLSGLCAIEVSSLNLLTPYSVMDGVNTLITRFKFSPFACDESFTEPHPDNPNILIPTMERTLVEMFLMHNDSELELLNVATSNYLFFGNDKEKLFEVAAHFHISESVFDNYVRSVRKG